MGEENNGQEGEAEEAVGLKGPDSVKKSKTGSAARAKSTAGRAGKSTKSKAGGGRDREDSEANLHDKVQVEDTSDRFANLKKSTTGAASASASAKT